MKLIIKETSWVCSCESLKSIRRLVFIEEQNVSVEDEWDDHDETATHFLVLLETKAIACARVLIEGDCFHIGRVAVLAEYRHQHVGRQLMQFVLSWCNQQKSHYKVYLHAQTSRVKFYEYLGFIAQGNVFIDAGIEHIEMWYQPFE